MPQRQVFGKKTRRDHDAFASMLYSSPKLAKASREHVASTTIFHDEPTTVSSRTVDLISRVKSNALQDISVNKPYDKKQQPGRKGCKVLESKQRAQPADTAASKSTAHPQTGTVKTQKKTNTEVGCVAQGYPQRQDRFGAESVADLPSKIQHQEDDVLSSHCDQLLELCEHSITHFSEWSRSIAEHLSVTKIAEASFGEVFRLSTLQSALSDKGNLEESVLKIIPLQPPESFLPTGKRQRNRMLEKVAFMSKPEDVAGEVKLLQRMSSVPGFTNFRDVQIVRGRPAGIFLKAYKAYNKKQIAQGKDTSHFPNPALKSTYSEDQLWAVIEMEDAGTDLERRLNDQQCSIWHVWDIFWRTTLALAKGEQTAEFEHRDLHLGNICVHSYNADDTPSSVESTKRLGFTKTAVTLIDYTISRASLQDELPGADIAYLDLQHDKHLFNGDSSDEYQYEIYRYMRSALFHDNPLAEFRCHSARDWAQFRPQTNIVWLHYILHMLMEKLDRPSLTTKPARGGKAALGLHRKALELEHVIQSLEQLLAPRVVIKNGLGSAGDLVTLALSNDWLRPEDVVGEEHSMIEKDLADTINRIKL